MTIALTVVVLVAVVIVAAQLAERLGIQPPLFLLGVGVIACLVPGVPVIELSPEVVLLGLLPPLLYAAALSTSLVDIRANLGSILSLAFGLVLFTALIVARLRFERLLHGSVRARDDFDRDPRAFTATFKRYHRAVPPVTTFDAWVPDA